MRLKVQIHLSTAIVLMFTAGILVWLNCGEVKEYVHDVDLKDGKLVANKRGVRVAGWPWRVGPERRILMVVGDIWVERFEPQGAAGLNWKLCTVDAGVALGILLSVAVGCEWGLRRPGVGGFQRKGAKAQRREEDENGL